MKRIIILVIVLAVGLLGLPQSAQAGSYPAGSITLSTTNLTVWADNCGEARFAVTARPTGEAANWTADVNVYDPRGSWVGGSVFAGYDVETSDTVFLCGGMDVAGRYRVTVAYDTYDVDDNELGHRDVTGYFTFTRRAKQSSSMAMVKTRKGAHSWKIVGRLTKAGRAWPGHRVQIQAYIYGGWETLKGKTTNRKGRVTFTSTPARGAAKYPLRLHSTGGQYVRDANSRAFRVKPR